MTSNVEQTEIHSPAFDAVSDAIEFLLPQRAISSRALLTSGSPFISPHKRSNVWIESPSPLTPRALDSSHYYDHDLSVIHRYFTPPMHEGTATAPHQNSGAYEINYGFQRSFQESSCPSLLLLETIQRERVDLQKQASYYTNCLYTKPGLLKSEEEPPTALQRIAKCIQAADKAMRLDAINSHLYRKTLADLDKKREMIQTTAQRREAETLKKCTFKPEISETAKSKKLHDAKPRGPLNFFDDGLKWMKEREKRLEKKIHKKNTEQAEQDEVNYKRFDVDKKSQQLLKNKEKELRDAEASGLVIKGTVEAMKAWQRLYPHAKNRFPTAKEMQNILLESSAERDMDIETLVAAEDKSFGNYFGYYDKQFAGGDEVGDQEDLMKQIILEDETLDEPTRQKLIRQNQLRSKHRRIKALERYIRQDHQVPYWAKECSFHPTVNELSSEMVARVWGVEGQKTMNSVLSDHESPAKYANVLERMEEDILQRREKEQLIAEEKRRRKEVDEWSVAKRRTSTPHTKEKELYLRKLMTGRTTSDALRAVEDQRAAEIKQKWLEERMAQQRTKVIQEMMSKEAQLTFLLNAVEDPDCDLITLAKALPSASARKYGAEDPRNASKSPTRTSQHHRDLPGHPSKSADDSDTASDAAVIATLKSGLKPRIKSTPAHSAVPSYAAPIAPLPDEVAPTDSQQIIPSTTYEHRKETPSFLLAQEALYDNARFEPNTDVLNHYNGSREEGANLATAAAYRNLRNVKAKKAKEEEIANDHLKLLHRERLSKDAQRNQLKRLSGYAAQKQANIERQKQEEAEKEAQICTFRPYVSEASAAMVARHEAEMSSFIQNQRQQLVNSSTSHRNNLPEKSSSGIQRGLHMSMGSSVVRQQFSTPTRRREASLRVQSPDRPRAGSTRSAVTDTKNEAAERVSRLENFQQRRWNSPAAQERYRKIADQSASIDRQRLESLKTEEKRLKVLVMSELNREVDFESEHILRNTNSFRAADDTPPPWPSIADATPKRRATMSPRSLQLLAVRQNTQLQKQQPPQAPLDVNNNTNYAFKNTLYSLANDDDEQAASGGAIPVSGCAHRIIDADAKLLGELLVEDTVAAASQSKSRTQDVPSGSIFTAAPIAESILVNPRASVIAADRQSYTSVDYRHQPQVAATFAPPFNSPKLRTNGGNYTARTSWISDAELMAMDDEITKLMEEVNTVTTPSPNRRLEDRIKPINIRPNSQEMQSHPIRSVDGDQPHLQSANQSLVNDIKGWFGHLASLRLSQVPSTAEGLQLLLETSQDNMHKYDSDHFENASLQRSSYSPSRRPSTSAEISVALEVAYAALNVALATSVAATQENDGQMIDWKHTYSELPFSVAVKSFPARLSLIEFASLFGKMYGIE